MLKFRLLAIAAMLPAPAMADLSAAELVGKMQQGGLVIYIRHASTETDYADQVSADPDVCSTQRVLSETGWQQARSIGAAIAALHIPVGDVIASQYCRAWQTADLAFGHYSKDSALNFEPAEDYAPAQQKAMRDHVLPLLTAPVAMGTNRVIVGHDDPFEAATGIYPEPMGVAYVLRPGADGAEVLGFIPPDAWPRP